MRHTVKGAFILAFGLVTGGCATPTTQSVSLNPDITSDEIRYQQELKVRTLIEYQKRIDRIGVPLLRAALPFCEDNRIGTLGLKVDNISAWPPEQRRLAKDLLQLDEALKVTDVTPGSVADKEGIKAGDMLLAVNNQATIGGPGAVEDYRQLMQQAGNGTVAFKLLRGDERLSVKVTPEPVCNYPLKVKMSNVINAYADGSNVVITSGLIRFAASDTEIAMVLAHEIAHNGMKHIESKTSNASVASVLDIVVAAAYGVNTHGLFANMGSQAFSKEFEQEADYVGLYIMARSHMPTDGVGEFWRRMAAEAPDTNNDSIFRTHPISAQRTLAIQQTTREINDKINKGEPLMPNQ